MEFWIALAVMGYLTDLFLRHWYWPWHHRKNQEEQNKRQAEHQAIMAKMEQGLQKNNELGAEHLRLEQEKLKTQALKDSERA